MRRKSTIAAKTMNLAFVQFLILSFFIRYYGVVSISSSKLQLIVSDSAQHAQLLANKKILPEQITVKPKPPYKIKPQHKSAPNFLSPKSQRKIHVFDEYLLLEESSQEDVLLIRYRTNNKTDIARENGTKTGSVIEVCKKQDFQDKIQSSPKSFGYEAIFGIYNFPSGPILALVTAAEDVFPENPPHQCSDLKRASEIALLPLSFPASNKSQTKKVPLAVVEGITLDLLRDAFYCHAFYFSRSGDATHTFQRKANLQEEGYTWEQADRRFFWNYHPTKCLQSVEGASPWIVPMTSAFVQVKHNCSAVAEGDESVEANLFDFMLISRRSAFRQGTRFTRRGIDDSGNVANFVESEQIIFSKDGQVTSHVQIRGSIPVYWSSPTNLKYTPPVKIESDKDQRMDAFSLHIEELAKHYGEHGVIFLNLVDKKKDQQKLGKMFDRTVRRKLKLDRMNGCSTPLNYVWFDFHAETKGMKWGHLQKLVNQVQDDFDKECFFHQAGNGTVIQHQSGVTRTNCMDCLDRTNVVQALLGRRTLLQQLLSTKIIDELPEPKPIEQEIIEEKQEGVSGIHEMDMPFPELESRFRDVWGNNADHISKLYAGTRALKGDYTRTGQRTKKGVLQDGYNSARRYFINNFLDHDRQRSIDLILGNTPPVSLDLIKQKKLANLDEWADLVDLEDSADGLAESNSTSNNGTLVEAPPPSSAATKFREQGSIALGLHRLGILGCAGAVLCLIVSLQQQSKFVEKILYNYLPKATLLILALIGQPAQKEYYPNDDKQSLPSTEQEQTITDSSKHQDE